MPAAQACERSSKPGKQKTFSLRRLYIFSRDTSKYKLHTCLQQSIFGHFEAKVLAQQRRKCAMNKETG